MARIIAAVMGDSLGHLNQVLAVAKGMGQHEFLFVGGGRLLELRGQGYSVEEIPAPGTFYANNRVDLAATIKNALRVFIESPWTVRRVREIIREYDPVLVLTSYEFFVPMAARKLGKLCISIDNQHFLTKCRHADPRGERLSRALFETPLRLMYSLARKYFINSFFPVQPLDPGCTEVFPPLIAPGVNQASPSDGEHILVYQTSPTFERLFTMLEHMPHRFVVYGFGRRPARKNLEFKAPSREEFLEDLASCRYVITNGGHTVISEALFLGKPVLSFPIQLAYEQFFNACMVRSLGYGDCCLDSDPGLQVMREFEKRIEYYVGNIKDGDFYGNAKMVKRLSEIIQSQESSQSND